MQKLIQNRRHCSMRPYPGVISNKQKGCYFCFFSSLGGFFFVLPKKGLQIKFIVATLSHTHTRTNIIIYIYCNKEMAARCEGPQRKLVAPKNLLCVLLLLFIIRGDHIYISASIASNIIILVTYTEPNIVSTSPVAFDSLP